MSSKDPSCAKHYLCFLEPNLKLQLRRDQKPNLKARALSRSTDLIAIAN
jgi:hypothetical protein